MDSNYVLVLWIQENKYSVVQRAKIEKDEDRAKTDEDLIGSTISVLWKSKPYRAEVIQCGAKIDLDYELSVLLNQQAESVNQGRRHVISELSCKARDSIREVLGLVQPEQHDETLVNELTDLRSKVEELEAKLVTEKGLKRKYREKYRDAKRQRDNLDSMEMKEIGDGVYLPASQLNTILAISNNSSKLARNLMGALYDEKEMYGRSLFGLRCNANKTLEPREAIEAKRRDAIIGFVHRSYGGSGLKTGDKRKNDPLLLSLHASMGDFLRYVTKKTKEPSKDSLV